MWLPPAEYKALESAIQTRYANNIPEEDFFLHGNNYYWYTCDVNTHKIECVWKMSIQGNEEKIAKRNRRFEHGTQN